MLLFLAWKEVTQLHIKYAVSGVHTRKPIKLVGDHENLVLLMKRLPSTPT